MFKYGYRSIVLFVTKSIFEELCKASVISVCLKGAKPRYIEIVNFMTS